tara:strand:- start:87 stop:413 length:327 start_codon:yes stop_codon:yes gene_type:complete
MRKISKEASEAFWGDRNFKKSNTEVAVFETDVFFYLHGHLIARRSRVFGDTLGINHCGWPTVTTKERLNAILNVGGYRERVYQKDYSWYISKDLEKDVPMFRGWNTVR